MSVDREPVEGEFVPGFGKDCKDCSKCGQSYTAPGSNCIEVGLEHNGRTQIWTKDKIRKDGPKLTGDREACWGFEKSTAASVRGLGYQAGAMIYAVGLSIPPF